MGGGNNKERKRMQIREEGKDMKREEWQHSAPRNRRIDGCSVTSRR